MRGRKPTATIGKAKKIAERQGYRWVPNPDADIPFDAFAYRGNDMFAVRVETCRNAPGIWDLFSDFFRNAYRILPKLPLPGYLPRELWVRYSWSRLFHRFRLVGTDLWEVTMIDRERPVFPYYDSHPTTSVGEGDTRRDEVK
jgi:hypothetical protein